MNIISIFFLFALLVAVIVYVRHTIMKQPRCPFSMSSTHMHYDTIKGRWSLSWREIQNVGVPQLPTEQGWHQDLPWLGIQLKHYDAFLNQVPLRLVNQLLFTQQGLFLIAYRQQQGIVSNMPALEDILFDDQAYITSNGETFTGSLAMLANRMQHMRQWLGYDLFIHENELHQPIEDVVGKARRHLTASWQPSSANE